jgi:hypothetical protein
MSTTESDRPQPSYQELLMAYDHACEAYHLDPNTHALAVLETGLVMLEQELHTPGTFALGQMVMTSGADLIMRESHHGFLEFLVRRKHGDWSEADSGQNTDRQQSNWYPALVCCLRSDPGCQCGNMAQSPGA